MICVFDCETIPDIELIKKEFSFGENIDDLSLSLMALDEQEKKSGTSFLPIPFHKIVAISAVIADEFGKFQKVSSIDGKSEEEMIKSFLKFIDRHNPKLISFNGRGFDIPMLFVRALKYNLSCPAFFEIENQMLNKTKWENYRSRYSEQFHVDLLDIFANYGSTRGLKLDTISAMVGAPGKFDISGNMVLELFYKGEINRIKEYCESDVLNTYILFLKYEILKGNLLLEDYKANLLEMGDKIPKEKSYFQVFIDFIKKEVKCAS